MNILQLCPRFPYPPTDGGRISIYNTTKGLALRGHTIDMITFVEPDTDEHALRALGEYCNVRAIHDNTKTNKKNFLRSVLRNEPVYITRHRSVKFYAALTEHLQNRRYNIVYGDHSAMLPYVIEGKRMRGLPGAIRMHNIESMIWKRYAEEERNPVKRRIAGRQASMLEQYEAHGAEVVDMNFTITDIDAVRLQSIAPRARITTVKPGVDMDYWIPRPRQPREATGMLATTFAWIHNVNGALWFMREALPLIIERIPAFTLHLLGANPPEVLARVGGEHIKLRGFVPDIRVEAARTGVYIVPLFVGSGIRIKILEAMAMGLPVVTTSVGCEGIGGIHGIHYLIADTAVEFAACVTKILSEPEYAERIGLAARGFIEENYRWERTISLLESAMMHIAAIPTVPEQVSGK